MEEKEKTTRKRRRGKPSTDSYLTAEDLPARIIRFNELLASGFLPSIAGAMIDPQAGEQQIWRWLNDCPGVEDWFRKHGAEEQYAKAREQGGAKHSQLVKQQQWAIVLSAQKKILELIDKGEIPHQTLLGIVKEGLVMAKMEEGFSQQQGGVVSEDVRFSILGISPVDVQEAIEGGRTLRKQIEEKT